MRESGKTSIGHGGASLLGIRRRLLSAVCFYIISDPQSSYICVSLGDYVEVRGIWDTSLSGHVSIAYSFDGRSPETRRYDSSNDYTFAPHFPYFNASLDEISYGNNTHVLSMEVMEVAGVQSFALGAIYYNPSFTSLSDMPNLTLSGSAAATSSTPNESSTPVSGGGSSGNDESPALTIAVPVVIGLIGVILLALGVCLFMKRKRRPRMPSKSARAIIEVEGTYLTFMSSFAAESRPEQRA